MAMQERGDPNVGDTRRQLAAHVRRERPNAYRVGDLLGPMVLAALWLVLPFETSTTGRWVGAITLAMVGPVDQIVRHRMSPEWSNFGLLIMRLAIASLLAFAVPVVWVPAAIAAVATAAGSTTVETPNRVGVLAILSTASLAAVGFYHDIEDWYLGVTTVAIVLLTHWLWFREWRSERAEVDRRHDEMVDRAHMFSWEIDVESGVMLGLAGNVESVLGYRIEELIGRNVAKIVDLEAAREVLRDDGIRDGDEVHSIVRAFHRDGREVTLRETRLASAVEGVIRGVSIDITELAEATEALRYQAEHDALTGLANRTVVEKVVNTALRERAGETVVLVMADLDRFKEINDTLGHPAGDRLLRVLARRLGDGLANTEVVARLGGDEFAFVAVGDGDTEWIRGLGAKVHELMTDPVEVDGLQLSVACSVGIAFSPDHGTTYPDLLKRADIATYQAKRNGGGVVTFETAPDDLSVRRLQLISETAGALDRGEFELHFQPQVDLATGVVIGVEGLARWRHPEYGLLLPGAFFHAIEVGACYQRFSNEMVRQAIEFGADALAAGHRLQVAVNLGSMSFLDRRLPVTIEKLLEQRGFPAKLLTLEVVETDLLDEQKGAGVFAELERLGVRLSIDDFGTGYSTFSRLRALDVAEVKIDRAFVQGLGKSTEDVIIVRSTVQLAHLLGHDVVAEGVETVEQLEWLQRIGCGVAQGFLWSRAVHPTTLFEMLDEGLAYDVSTNAEPVESWTLDAEVRGSLLEQREDPETAAAITELMGRVEHAVGSRAVVVKDLAGRLVDANQRFRLAVGATLFEQFIGSRDDDFASGPEAGHFVGDGFEVNSVDVESAAPSTETLGEGVVATVQIGATKSRVHTSVTQLRDRSSRLIGSVFVLTPEE